MFTRSNFGLKRRYDFFWSDHVSICECGSTWIGRVSICSFCLLVLFGIWFQLSNVDFGSTKIVWCFWRLSIGLNDRCRFVVCHVSIFDWVSIWTIWFIEADRRRCMEGFGGWIFQVWIVDLASTWIGWEIISFSCDVF